MTGQDLKFHWVYNQADGEATTPPLARYNYRRYVHCY